MGARIAFIAAFLALALNLLQWLTLQPLLRHALVSVRSYQPAVAERIEEVLPALGAFLLLLTFALAFLSLYVAVGLPLRRLLETVQSAAQDTSGLSVADGGASPFQTLTLAVRRMATSTREERAAASRRIAELQQVNERMSRLQAQLVSSDRLATVGKLAAGVAHEVGNPLSGILGYLSVLRLKAREPVTVGETCDLIEVEVKRIDGIVRALLDLGRPSRDAASVVDVRPILESCVRLLQSSAELTGVEVRLEAPDEVHVLCEAGPLAQVVINLLLNAAEAMDGRGVITMRASADGEICVLDEGTGLRPEVQARLYEVFFTTKAPGRGTGLGLAVSRHLLEQFGASIAARNRDDGIRGACFTITLLKA